MEITRIHIFALIVVILMCTLSCCICIFSYYGKDCLSERYILDGNSNRYSAWRVDASSILKDCKKIKYNCNSRKLWGFFRRKDYARNSVCTICLEDFTEEEEVVLCPCKHCYHENCIKEWLRLKNSCPLCKLNIRRGLTSESTPLLYVA